MVALSPRDRTETSDSSSANLLNGRSIFDGAILGATAYGAHAVLFLMSFVALWTGPRNKTKLTYFFLAYTTLNFILGTLYDCSTSVVAQSTLVDGSNIHNADAFEPNNFGLPLEFMGSVVAIIGSWSTNALLLWRGFVIYRGSVWCWVMLIPAAIYVASFVMSSILLALLSQAARDGSLTWQKIFLPFYILSLSITISVTFLISLRLLVQRREIINVLGVQHANKYISIVAMLVESASIGSVFSVPFLTLFIMRNPIWNSFTPVGNQLEYIAPLLIIYRAAHGQAYSSDTTAIISEVVRRLPLTDDNLVGGRDVIKSTNGEAVNLYDGREVPTGSGEGSEEPQEPQRSG